MIVASWLDSNPFETHGSLIERPILTKRDPRSDIASRAVLKSVNCFSRGIVEARQSTQPASHEEEQEVVYVVCGEGILELGGNATDIRDGSAAFIPPNVSHRFVNESDSPMELLLLRGDDKDKTRASLVRDVSNIRPYVGHWNHQVWTLFKAEDGLSKLDQVLIVKIDGMQVPEPHSHSPGSEEIWYMISGRGLHWVGKEVRHQLPGMAVVCIPWEDVHSLINYTDEPLKTFYFAYYGKR